MFLSRVSEKDGKLVDLYFGDQFLATVSRSLISPYLKQLRSTSSYEMAQDLLKEAFTKITKNYAAYLLGKKSFFRQELSKKLESKGFPEYAVQESLDFLEKVGALSDEKKLSLLVEKAIKKGKGRAYILSMVRQYQLDESLTEKCLERVRESSQETIEKLLSSKLKKYSISVPSERKKMIMFLQRQGFSLDDIFSCLNQKR